MELTERLLGVNEWCTPTGRYVHEFELAIEESRDLFEGELRVCIVSPTDEKSQQMRLKIEVQVTQITKFP